MKEVGNKLKLLRGERSLDDAAKQAGLSRETLRKIEAGHPIKLKTLKALNFGLGGTEADWMEILCAWLRWHARAEADKLTIEPRQKTSKLRHAGADSASELEKRFRNLSHREQQQILKALDRPPVLRSIAHLNALFESASKP